MDWNDLRYLLAIHRGGSLAGAAKALGVTKATASRRLSALEEALGTELVARTPEGFTLTEAGKTALGTAEEISKLVGMLEGRVGTCAGSVKGKVRLTAPQWLAERLILHELPALRAEHPGLEVQLLGTNDLLDMTRLEADLALRNVKPTQLSLVARKVGSMAGRIYASKLYLERRGRPLSRAALVDHDLLAYERIGGMPGFEWVREPPFAERVVFRANDPVGLRSAAAAGLGLAGIPCILGDEEPALERIDELGEGLTDEFIVMPEQLRENVPVRIVSDFIAGLMQRHEARLLGR